MINHKYKFVYLGLGKCASSSIHEALKDLPECEGGQHFALIRLLENHQLPKDYFVFTFCRNPFDRLVSAWREFNKLSQFKWAKKHEYWQQDKFKERNLSLQKVSNNFHNFFTYTTIQDHMHWLKLENLDKMIDVDFIGKFENLQKDFDKLCDTIGIPNKTLGTLNKTKNRKHYSLYYDEHTKSMVESEYKYEIEKCVYHFVNPDNTDNYKPIKKFQLTENQKEILRADRVNKYKRNNVYFV